MEHRILNVIENKQQPLAILMETVNTEPYSAFTPFTSINLLQEGSLEFYNEFERIKVKEGQFWFAGRYSNFKVQRQLGSNGLYRSVGFLIQNPDQLGGVGKVFALRQTPQLSELLSSVELQFKQKAPFENQKLHRLHQLLSSIITEIDFNEQKDSFLEFLYQNLTVNITIAKLAAIYGKSTASFSKHFVDRMGKSPHKWIKEQRLHFARLMMQYTQKPVSQIYQDFGFEDLAHFSKAFKAQFGYNPSDTYGKVQINIIR